MQLTFLGTGGAQQVPVFGCECTACGRARTDPAFRRQPCSAKLDYAGEVTLIDAGLPELAQPFTTRKFGTLELIPLPLNHSKITFGYLIKTECATVAYLTDTAGLPRVTARFLAGVKLDALILDCSHPPRNTPDKNHNDIRQALAIHRQLKPKKTYLTHISHQLDLWLMDHALEANVIAAHDGLRLEWS